MGFPTDDMNLPTLETTDRPKEYVGVKAPMFSFTRLRGSDPVLGIEMASTGEVACFGAWKEEAFLKALLSIGFKMPNKNIMLSVTESLQEDVTHCAYQLHELGCHLYATKEMAEILKKNRVPCTIVSYATENDSERPNPLDLLRSKEIGLVNIIPSHLSTRLEDNFQMQRTAVDFGVPLLTNMNLVKDFTDAIYEHKKETLLGLEPSSLFEH
jgi:hypothetical protein